MFVSGREVGSLFDQAADNLQFALPGIQVQRAGRPGWELESSPANDGAHDDLIREAADHAPQRLMVRSRNAGV